MEQSTRIHPSLVLTADAAPAAASSSWCPAFLHDGPHPFLAVNQSKLLPSQLIFCQVFDQGNKKITNASSS